MAKQKPTQDDADQADQADQAEEIVESTVDTLHGDMTSAIVEELQHLEDVWPKLSEAKQKSIIDRCQAKASDMIRRAVRLIAGQGFEHAPAVIESVTFKDGVKVVAKMHDRTGAHLCADHEGRAVTVIFADPDQYLHGGDFPEPAPDQGDLPLNKTGDNEQPDVDYEAQAATG